ncbi:MAG: MFS transporter [Hydrogenophilaceae bacterium]|nr:MFS transporter [Hydrogenophilaceae bacterium]
MSEAAAPGAGAIIRERTKVRLNRGEWAWALFEWARNPYVILCLIYLFAPYLAQRVFADPIEGQTQIAGWHKIAGVAVALTAPFLGAAADRMGRRKPMLGVVVLLLTPAIFIQYWAAPAGVAGGLPIWGIGACVIAAGILFAYTEVLHNSMLPSVSAPAALPHTSGLGLALGNAAAVLMLASVAWGLALPGVVQAGWIPAAPLFGLDPVLGEPSRAVAPLVAVWFLVFSLPLFLFTPDQPSSGASFAVALRQGVRSVAATLRKLRDHRNVATFLVARMLYADGKAAILIFGGVYAAGIMDWGLLEMCAFGVVLSVFAVAGGVLGGWLDHWIGPKNAVALEIGVTFLCLVGMVSMTPETIFFVVPVPAEPVWASPIFGRATELAYLAVTMVVAISITAAYASSRTLMARLSPAGMEGELFGLYALAGSATVWLGPLLVEHFTHEYQSLRAGFGSIGVLLLAGFALMLFVKPPTRA